MYIIHMYYNIIYSMYIPCIYVHNTMYRCLTVVDMVCMFSFIQWMYPSGGGEENVESAALGIIILWTTWYIYVIVFIYVYLTLLLYM